MDIKSKKVRTLTEEEYLVNIANKQYKYIDFVGDDGKFTSWSMTDDKNENVIANEPEIIQIVAAIQNAVDKYNDRTPRHEDLANESNDEDS